MKKWKQFKQFRNSSFSKPLSQASVVKISAFYNAYLCMGCNGEYTSEEEKLEEGGECKNCHKTMCDRCREGKTSDRCEETICDTCFGSCEGFSDSRCCEDCFGEDKQSCCYCVTRAERKLETLNKSVRRQGGGKGSPKTTLERSQSRTRGCQRGKGKCRAQPEKLRQ